MATTTKSTKAELLAEIATLRKQAGEISTFKKKVATAVVECIEEYDLDLCDDGIDDFFNRIGTERPAQTKPCGITLYLTGIEAKAESGHYGGLQFDTDKLQSKLEVAVNKVLTEHGSGHYDFAEVEPE